MPDGLRRLFRHPRSCFGICRHRIFFRRLIVFSKYDIKGLELSEEKTALRAELIEEARKNKKGSPVVSISAILDKSQIGSGAITLEQITPE